VRIRDDRAVIAEEQYRTWQNRSGAGVSAGAAHVRQVEQLALPLVVIDKLIGLQLIAPQLLPA
jgi:hypothetical protein